MLSKKRKMMIGVIAILYSLPFLVILPTTGTADSTNFPSQNGDWIVNTTTSVNDKTIILNGNLTVKNNGNLALDNITLLMNCTYDGEYYIEVQDGGSLYIYNSNITAVNTSCHYLFWVRNNSKFEMKNSELHECGGNGLTVETNGILIENSMFSNNNCGIYLSRSQNNTISNCTLLNNCQGIYLSMGSSNNKISDCTISTNSGCGIKLYYSSINSVLNCTISNNGNGINLERSSNNIISGCIALNNSYGLHISSSENNNVSNCALSNNNYGIYLDWYAYTNQITRSTISNNHASGIRIYSSSDNCITNSTISNNSEGIYIHWHSDGNYIHHNNFVNNTNQAYDECSNYWDNSSIGNYWRDYTNADINADGIGDDPYYIPGNTFWGGGNNKDSFPLLSPINMLIADFDYTPKNPNDLDTIQFIDTSKVYGVYVTTWSWDFGDSTSSNEKNTTHKYTDNGTYVVSLKITDCEGVIALILKEIIVRNVEPIANFTYLPQNPTTLDTIYFTDLSQDLDGTIISFYWDFGDGYAFTLQNPEHTYSEEGNYYINLTVWDDDEVSNMKTISITIILDTDKDGIPDATDTDDDNDGLTDIEEVEIGTDPLKSDTDWDGYNDNVDAYPLDPSKWEKPKKEKPALIPSFESAYLTIILSGCTIFIGRKKIRITRRGNVR